MDMTHFMVASYFVIGNDGRENIENHTVILLYLSQAMPVN